MAELAVIESAKTDVVDGATACLTLLETLLPREAAMRVTLELCAAVCADSLGISRADAFALCDACATESLPPQVAIPPLFKSRALALVDGCRASLRTAGDLGDVYERLLASRSSATRKRRGSFFTPAPVARRLVARVFELHARTAPGARELRVLDPAMGAGRFLLEALAFVPGTALHGVDTDAWAVWVARVSVTLACHGQPLGDLNARLRVADALAAGALDFVHADIVIGNPPWVAHAGRQSVKLDARDRDDYRKRFRSFAGFPTTHGMFVELCARSTAENGVIGLLLPTQVADLTGYAATRAVLTDHARIDVPLEELGFGQFAGVVEPTLVLLATRDRSVFGTGDAWVIAEREGVRPRPVPSELQRRALERLRDLPRFPPETFGEAGFQTGGEIARTHLGDWPSSDARFSIALREGRDIESYYTGPPSRALHPDPVALKAARIRLRTADSYHAISVLIRQTARFPIAALHEPRAAFRNSLLAGYSADPEILVALLNSELLRALHLASQRDGRQIVFPQVKIAHLRALPSPPPGRDFEPLRVLASRAGAAQRARHECTREFTASFGGLGKALFATDGDSVPTRPDALKRLCAASKRSLDGRVNAEYRDALARVNEAWTAYRLASREIDDAVYAIYGIADDERPGFAP